MSFISKNPYTRKLLKEVPAWTKYQTSAAIEKLYKEYESNREIGPEKCKEKMKASLHRLAGAFGERKRHLAEAVTKDTGKPIKFAEWEVDGVIGIINLYNHRIDELLAPKIIQIDPNAESGYYLNPLGVAYKIVPFNFPVVIAMNMVITATLTGNTVLLRPPNIAPSYGVEMQKIFDEADFASAQVGFTAHEDLSYILNHNEVFAVSFTGSTPSGRKVAEEAGKHLKRAVLELGGNDPLIICQDADLGTAIKIAAQARLMNSGQVCFASKRIFVHQSLKQQFVEGLKAALEGVKVGDPMKDDTTMGPLASDEYAEKYQRQLKTTIERGDKVLYGNREPDGNLIWPTIIEVSNFDRSLVTNEEVFGPLFSIISFESADDAVRMANNTQYGLSSIIVSKDLEKARAMGRRLNAGSTYINSNVMPHPLLPFGGVKNSGYGRDLGHHGVETYANIKAFWINKA